MGSSTGIRLLPPRPAIVAVSRYTAKKTRKAFVLRSIEVIYNGIDCNRFTPVAKTTPHHPFRLLYVGNWSARKGVDLLGPIMELLGQDFELRYTADRQGMHKRYHLPPNCLNLGRLSTGSLIPAYQKADALLFPTRLEGFGLVAAEAMACGLPVIATRGSALPEVIADGETGLLCPQDDVRTFARAALRLSTDRELRYAMRKAARRRIGSHFDIESMVKSYLSIYLEILQTYRANGGRIHVLKSRV